MRKTILLIAILTFSVTSFAQLEDNSISPDFTATDINGVEHNLYDLLDEGKSVILDIMSTGCGPCWLYHGEGVLEEVWQEYGPEGTDEIYVFMIETNLSSGLAELNGTNVTDVTFGDWVTGTPYPIIDDSTPNPEFVGQSQINYDFNVNFWPTIYHICPDRRINMVGQLPSAEEFLELSASCGSLSGDINAALIEFSTNFDPSLCFTQSINPSVKMQNLGTNVITEAAIDFFVNEELVESIQWQGDLSSYQFEEVTFETAITSDASLSFEVTSVNGTDDDSPIDNVISEDIIVSSDAALITTETFVVEILTDIFGEETYWAILDATGEVVTQGGNTLVGLNNIGVGAGAAPVSSDQYNSTTLYTEQITLPSDGCYEFVITDFYGDGMGGNGLTAGYYMLLDGLGDTLISGSEFEAIVRHDIAQSDVTSLNEYNELDHLVSVFPNPSTDGSATLKIDHIPDTQLIQYQIVNAMGQELESGQIQNTTSGNLLPIDTDKLGSGILLIRVLTGQHSITVPLIVK